MAQHEADYMEGLRNAAEHEHKEAQQLLAIRAGGGKGAAEPEA